MADIELHRVHALGLKAARVAAEKMAADLGRKFGLQGDWEGDVLRFQRPGVNGLLAVTDKDMRLSVTLGFLLKAMKASIEKAVEQEVDELFAKVAGPGAKAGAKPGARAGAKAKKAPPRPKRGG
jgi:putative polyhydroxyalkanoate system protein